MARIEDRLHRADERPERHGPHRDGGTHHQAWLECEGYWTPKVGAPEILGQPNPQFNPELAQKFAVLTQAESDRIHGIKR